MPFFFLCFFIKDRPFDKSHLNFLFQLELHQHRKGNWFHKVFKRYMDLLGPQRGARACWHWLCPLELNYTCAKGKWWVSILFITFHQTSVCCFRRGRYCSDRLMLIKSLCRLSVKCFLPYWKQGCLWVEICIWFHKGWPLTSTTLSTCGP